MWQAIQNRLPTIDRLKKCRVECNAIFSLCKVEDELRDHLFHGCKYTKEVRVHISRFFIGIRWQNSFANEIEYMCRVCKKKKVKAHIVMMRWTEMIYNVWYKRNFRIFEGVQRSAEQLPNLITFNVAARLDDADKCILLIN